MMKLRGLHGEMHAGKCEEGEREGLMINRQEVARDKARPPGSDCQDLAGVLLVSGED